jgi:hypothetical protein
LEINEISIPMDIVAGFVAVSNPKWHEFRSKLFCGWTRSLFQQMLMRSLAIVGVNTLLIIKKPTV